MVPFLLSLALLGMASPLAGGVSPLADEPVTYNFVGNAALHHVRFPDTDNNGVNQFGQERGGFGVNYQQAAITPLTSAEASFARLVVNAESAGTYNIPLTFKAGNYPVNVYVNSVDNVETHSISGNWGEMEYDDLYVNLNQGQNVLVFQVFDWGSLRTFTLPAGLDLVKTSYPVGTYGVESLIFQATYLSGTIEDLFNPATTVSYQDLILDANQQYKGAAIAYITPAETNPSLDVTIKMSSKGATNSLAYSVGPNVDSYKTVDLSAAPLNEEYTVHLPSYELASMGYASSQENYVRIANAGVAGDGAFTVISIKESSQTDVDPVGPTTYVGAEELKSLVNVRGRSLETLDAIPLDWSASGLDFVYEGSGSLVLHTDVASSIQTQNTKFVVDIDGDVHYVNVTPETILATELEDGTHSVSIYKTSEAAGNLLSVTGIEYSNGGEIRKSAAKELKFEFIGDSVTCANQVAMNVEDAYQGFARRIANAYDADFDVISVSGRGLMEGFNSESNWAMSKDAQMKDIYNYQSYFRDSNTLAEEEEADVIVVGLGSNDLGASIMATLGTTIEDFTAEATAFATKLRTANPSAEIVFAYGMYYNRDYIPEYKAAIEGLNDENIAFVEIPQMMLGDSGHANELNHDEIGGILSKKISEMLGVSDPYVREYDYQTLEAEDALIFGGEVKQKEGDQYWSGGAYVGDMGPSDEDGYATSIEEIADDATNVKRLTFTFEVPETAEYEIRIGYATGTSDSPMSSLVGYRFDGEPWQETTLTGSDWCGGHGLYSSVYGKLTKGLHSFTITGDLNPNGWINYDFFNVVKGDPVNSYQVKASTGTGYSIPSLPTEVVEGEDLSFSVKLEQNYSKSPLVVSNNGTALTPNADGTYTILDVSSDVNISVSGVTLNKWKVTYYAYEGAEAFASFDVTVGEEITIPSSNPTREGYTFIGWIIDFDAMPNSDINVYAEWEAIGSGDSSSDPDGDSSSSDESSSLPSEDSSSTSTPSDPSDSGDEKPRDNTVLWIVLGVVGGVVVLAAAGLGIFFYLKKRKK